MDQHGLWRCHMNSNGSDWAVIRTLVNRCCCGHFVLFVSRLVTCACRVQGTVKAEGRGNNPVVFRLRNETTAHNHSLVRLGTEEGAMEGRLQVRPTEADEWGTVCNKVSGASTTTGASLRRNSLGYQRSARWQHFEAPSTLPGETNALQLLTARAALPKIRVETLIGSQANYEIKLIR